MIIAILAIVAAAILVPVLHRRLPRAALGLAVAAPAGAFLGFALQMPAALGGASISESVRWAPHLGISAVFLLDGLSAIFAVIVPGIGVLVILYAIPYLHDPARIASLLGLILLFMGSMLGVVLADDMMTLFVFWELTSISSFFLIGFESRAAESRGNALQALIVTAGGGLALLLGLLLMRRAGIEAGLHPDEAWRLSALNGVGLAGQRYYVAAVLLVCLGAFTKSAQVPFHFWLPAAMVAPTPVSAYLHSATMVKAGIFVLARTSPALGGTALWTWLLGGVGAATMLYGAAAALGQRDLKRILAYSTIAVLGALTMLLGLGSDLALVAFAALLVAHACYKASLFLVAGAVDHACGDRDAYRGSALAWSMPGMAVIAALAGLSMAGAPPAAGFVAKESLYAAALEPRGWATLPAAGAAVIAGTLLVMAALVVVVATFFRGARQPCEGLHLPARTMIAAPAVLAVAGLLAGVWPGALNALAGPMARAIAGTEVVTEVALWHGIDPPHGLVLALGALSLLIGGLGYRRLSAAPPAVRAPAAAGGYERAVAGLYRVSGIVASGLQSGSLRRYVALTLAASLLFIAPPVIAWAAGGIVLPPLDVQLHELLLILAIVAGGIKLVQSTDRLTAVAALGVTGLGIAFLFALLNAPDLAITQLMVETLMVILLVLVFRRLPPRSARQRSLRVVMHVVLSAAVGVTMTLLLLALGTPRYATEASSYFAAQEAAAHGNVVNAILVNYRALDTFGEITVVAIAGLGVIALLRLGPGRGGKHDRRARGRGDEEERS